MKKKGIIMALVFFLAVGLSGCTEESISTYDDKDFSGWAAQVSEVIRYDLNNMRNAINLRDYETLSSLGAIAESHADQYIREINMFHVSPEMQKIKDEFFLLLQDYRWLGFYTRYLDIEKATDYTVSVGSRTQTINYLLEQYLNQ